MDEDIEEKWAQIQEKLNEIFGEDNAHVVGCVKGKSLAELFGKASTFMTRPIVTLKANRMGTSLEVNKCSTDEAYNAAIHIITHCLHMFPTDMRNDMLYSAIQDIEDKYDEGMLFMKDEDENEE